MENSGNNIQKKRIPLRETDVIQEYLDGIAIKDLAEKYDCTHQNVGQFLRNNGIATEKRIQTKSPYTLDEHWLDKIDCQEKAYFLGFFGADGYNDPKRNRVKFKLQVKDRDILEKFKECFKSNRPLIYGEYERPEKNGSIEYTYELYLTSSYLSNKLTELGYPPNKTEILQFPTNIPEEYLSHYIRGYFDGDGSISISQNKNGTYKAEVTIVSSKYFNESLNQFLIDKFNIKANLYEKEHYLVLKIQKQNDLKKFLDYIYKDSKIHLNRKYERYITFINSRDFSKLTLKEKSKKVKADSDKIIKRYLEGEAASVIAKNYDCSSNVILRLLKANNIEIRKNTTPQQRALKVKQENK